MEGEALNLVKVFSTTKPKDRDSLGERVTAGMILSAACVFAGIWLYDRSKGGFKATKIS